jgi:vitamin K-dependent gamma-carboxylase
MDVSRNGWNGWLRPLPGAGMTWLFAALAFLAVLIALGLCYRAAACLFFLGYTYAFLLEQSNYQNHLYLFCLLAFLLLFTSPHREFSLDARIFPRVASAAVPAWQLHIFKFQLGLVYFLAGVAKLQPEWLSGGPMRQNLVGSPGLPFLGDGIRSAASIVFLTYAGVCIDTFCVFSCSGKGPAWGPSWCWWFST